MQSWEHLHLGAILAASGLGSICIWQQFWQHLQSQVETCWQLALGAILAASASVCSILNTAVVGTMFFNIGRPSAPETQSVTSERSKSVERTHSVVCSRLFRGCAAFKVESVVVDVAGSANANHDAA